MTSQLQNLMINRTKNSSISWDCNEIYPGIFLGSLQAALDIVNLRNNSICGVLTVANKLQVNLPEDIKHLQIEIADHPCAMILEHLNRSFEFIDNILSQSNNNENKHCVLVHCASGVSRSVSICCAWLMTHQNISFDESLEIVRFNRMRANPNLGFKQQLSFFERYNHNVSEAISQYNLKYQDVNILDVIKKQRDEVNDIYLSVDNIENEIKGTSSIDNNSQMKVSWKEQLNSLLNLLDQIAQRSDDNLLVDPPTVSIRKSAISKILRLLEDLD